MTWPGLALIPVPTVRIERLFSDVDYRAWAIFISITLVAVGAFIWAAFVRKRRADPHFHPILPTTGKPPRHEPAWSLGRLFRSKRRRHRRRQRRTNPTRAETGGLPPVRAEDSPPATD